MSDLEAKLRELEESALARIDGAATPEQLEALRVSFLGRKEGAILRILQSLATADPIARPVLGQRANAIKTAIESRLNEQRQMLSRAPSSAKTAVDPTLPGERTSVGRLHPLTQVTRDIVTIFESMGFRWVWGPEIETDFYNFEALNIPPDHPSRESFDTYYLTTGELLRSQTSTVQIRLMQKEKPPLAIIASGRVYRPDAVDASHSFMFHQLEGLWVDERVSFADLKGTLSLFVRRFFGPNTPMRFRPHYFPFTEPSAEVDIGCVLCRQKGCRVCGQKGWVEVLGAGLVHPAVFRAVKYPAGRWTGFAFGMGIERLAMLKYGIDDIRLFLENDLRFLGQF